MPRSANLHVVILASGEDHSLRSLTLMEHPGNGRGSGDLFDSYVEPFRNWMLDECPQATERS